MGHFINLIFKEGIKCNCGLRNIFYFELRLAIYLRIKTMTNIISIFTSFSVISQSDIFIQMMEFSHPSAPDIPRFTRSALHPHHLTLVCTTPLPCRSLISLKTSHITISLLHIDTGMCNFTLLH